MPNRNKVSTPHLKWQTLADSDTLHMYTLTQLVRTLYKAIYKKIL